MQPTTSDILAVRGERTTVDAWRPAHFLSELEFCATADLNRSQQFS
jgi:hypothetical protein